MVIEPGLYVGSLRHRRFSPVVHAFTYHVFMVLLDIDRIPALMAASRLLSLNRWNWASFDDRDHLGDPTRPLRERLVADARRHGIGLSDGPIFLLTHLRHFGYGFNPVSFFYVLDRAGGLDAVLAEVNNTWGGSRTYWLRPGPERPFRASAAKSLEVSPFMPAVLDYRFTLTPPGERLTVHIEARPAGATMFDATLSLERRPWSAREIRRRLVRHPLMTAQVTAGIHWQALRLWWKGARRVSDAEEHHP